MRQGLRLTPWRAGVFTGRLMPAMATTESPPLHAPAPAARMLPPWQRLWASRGLLLTLVKRDIKVKYKESFLGFFWSFAKPLFQMLILAAVFTLFFRFELTNPNIPYPLHLVLGLLPWVLLVNGLNDSLHSITGNGNLIKKVRVETEVFPLAAIFSNTIHFLFSLLVLVVFMAWYGIGLGKPIILLPIALGIQLILMIGLALLLSSLNVVFRDIASIFETILFGWMYATPIFYDYGLVRRFLEEHPDSSWVQYALACNPMVGIMVAYRRSVLYTGERAREAGSQGLEMTDMQLLLHLLISLGIGLLLLIVGLLVFRRLSRVFADRM